MELWLIGIIAFFAVMIIGVFCAKSDTEFDKGFRESNGIFDNPASGKELFFEHIESVRRADRNRDSNRTFTGGSRSANTDNTPHDLSGFIDRSSPVGVSSFFSSSMSGSNCDSGGSSGGSCGGE